MINDTGAWTPNSKERARERETRRDHGTNPAHRTDRPDNRFWIGTAMILSQAGDEVRGQTEARRDHGTTGPRDHPGTPNGSPAPPILDPGTHDLSQAGDEARGQTGPQDHGTTGPPGHTERVHRATDSGAASQ